MKKYSIAFIVSLVMAAWIIVDNFRHHEYTQNEKAVCQCFCRKCQKEVNRPSLSDLKVIKQDGMTSLRFEPEWSQGEFITLRKVYPHSCGGNLVFNGGVQHAPYSDRDQFFTHVCDRCSVTNQILNATWPQYKQEWRVL
jgi:hypothetical protein